jgi:hypothetical protein
MKKDNEFEECVELLLYSIVPIILIWITLMGITFLFTKEISYTLGFWVYSILSSALGLILTQTIIYKARK